MNSPERKLTKLLKFKIELQELEQENEKNKEVWRSLGFLIRHTSQKLKQQRDTLIEMI